ncbi:hypothetical protein [Duganella qianjiadongensis]|uniref:Uncharacterized protein n=1 Tax=Duganella qianjiadongensis TaxID=2692176 RepID=A0ABW9VM79_9BURK|nr:hypothetical protein [Duganella qianjiadongensis]MYM38762.1 hypothetical protein [Duganella qianjiadongensis]
MPIKTSSIRNYLNTNPLQECSRKNIENRIKALESKTVHPTQPTIARASSKSSPYKLVTNLFERVRIALFSNTAEKRIRAIARLNTFVALESSAQNPKEKKWYATAIDISLAKCKETGVAVPRDALSKAYERDGLTSPAYAVWENYCNEKKLTSTLALTLGDVASNDPFADISETATMFSIHAAPAEYCMNPFGMEPVRSGGNNLTPFDPNESWS